MRWIDARRKLGHLGALRDGHIRLSISLSTQLSRTEEELREILDSAGAEIYRIPKLAMKLSHDGPWIDERPFDAAGQDGYRDTLLWETLVAAANDQEPIVLVSGDNAASSPNKGPGLLTELQDELEARGSLGRQFNASNKSQSSPRSCRWCRSSKWTLSTRWLTSVAGHIVEALTEEVVAYEEGTPRIPGFPLEVDQLFVDWVGEPPRPRHHGRARAR